MGYSFEHRAKQDLPILWAMTDFGGGTRYTQCSTSKTVGGKLGRASSKSWRKEKPINSGRDKGGAHSPKENIRWVWGEKQQRMAATFSDLDTHKKLSIAE